MIIKGDHTQNFKKTVSTIDHKLVRWYKRDLLKGFCVSIDFGIRIINARDLFAVIIKLRTQWPESLHTICAEALGIRRWIDESKNQSSGRRTPILMSLKVPGRASRNEWVLWPGVTKTSIRFARSTTDFAIGLVVSNSSDIGIMPRLDMRSTVDLRLYSAARVLGVVMSEPNVSVPMAIGQ